MKNKNRLLFLSKKKIFFSTRTLAYIICGNFTQLSKVIGNFRNLEFCFSSLRRTPLFRVPYGSAIPPTIFFKTRTDPPPLTSYAEVASNFLHFFGALSTRSVSVWRLIRAKIFIIIRESSFTNAHLHTRTHKKKKKHYV